MPVKLYACPSRRVARAESVVDRDTYGEYNGGGWRWGKTDYAGNDLLILHRPRCLGINAVTDGTTHTLLVGEKSFDPEVHVPTTWYFDEPFFTGGSGGTTRWVPRIFRDAVGIPFKGTWGSPHRAGSQFLFVDGSVRLIAYNTETAVVQGAMTPSGGEITPDF